MNTKFISIHYGELALKKRNRGRFENCLLSNLTATLHQLGIRKVRKLPGRLLFEFEEPTSWKLITDRIRKVFGYSSASPVHCVAPHLEELESAVLCEARKITFSSFAVATKRADKNFPLTSPQISAKIGGAIQDLTGAKVDLTNPEKLFNIEVLGNEILFSHEKVYGSRGLPVGTGGHVLALLSGGIDSPVASWMMMKRGVKASFIHFHSMPFTDLSSIEKVEEMADELASWEGTSKIALVPFGNLQKKIVTSVPSKYRVILYRRFMMRIASILAKTISAEALVTGEALGQVASQTLSNIATVEAASDLPILRPLVGMDKQEIVDLSKKIGTYKMSIQPHQDCCNFLQPPNPATRTTARELEGIEQDLDVAQMVEESVSEAEWRTAHGE